jgi:hypothetical protein
LGEQSQNIDNELIISTFGLIISEFCTLKEFEAWRIKDYISQLIDFDLFGDQNEKYLNLQKLIDGFSSLHFHEISKSNLLKFSHFFEEFYPIFIEFKEKEDLVISIFSNELPGIDKAIRDNKIENEKTSCNFNTLKLFEINEPLHSRLLAKLLNPKAEHGQGNKFLTEFLKLLEIQNPEEGIWHVTAETGRIDVLLRRSFPESIIIIENKSNWAQDQQNQLYRYWYSEIFSRIKQTSTTFYEENKDKYKIIYLPPTEYKEPEPQSYSRPNHQAWNKKELPEMMPIKFEIKSYKNFIVQWLENCLDTLPDENNRMTEYIKQYIEICKTL